MVAPNPPRETLVFHATEKMGTFNTICAHHTWYKFDVFFQSC